MPSLAHALHDAVDDFAFALGVQVVLRVTLGFADALQDHLLGGLRGDAPEAFRRRLDHDHVADLGVRHDLAGLVQRHFRAPVGDLVGHFFFSVDVRQAGLAVDDGGDVLGAGRVDITPVGADQGRVQGLQHHLFGQVALAADLVKGE